MTEQTNGTTTNGEGGGTTVARGDCVVPAGILVQEFVDNDVREVNKMGLETDCPEVVRVFLESKGAVEVYTDMIKKMVSNGTASVAIDGGDAGSNMFNVTTKMTQAATNLSKGGRKIVWCEPKLVKYLQASQPLFEEKGVLVKLCLYHSACKRYRWFWFEFIDASSALATNYVSKYDVSHYKVVLEDAYMIPPKGVAVLHLDDWNEKNVKTKIPPTVQELFHNKSPDLMPLYEKMTKTIYDTKGVRTFYGSWKTSNVLPVVQGFQADFRAHGIEVTVCKRSWAMGMDFWKWIEFYDMELFGSNSDTTNGCCVPAVFDVDPEKRQAQSARSTMFRSVVKHNVVIEELVVNGAPAASPTPTTPFESENVDEYPYPPPPEAVSQLLAEKGLTPSDHARLRQAMDEAKSIRNFCDIWRMKAQGVIPFPVLQDFQTKFQTKGIQVLLCQNNGVKGKTVWLEYVDTKVTPDYTSVYDITNHGLGAMTLSGSEQQVPCKTVAGGRHSVPRPVAVLEITGKSTKLKDPAPPQVQQLMERNNLWPMYQDFVQALIQAAGATTTWDKCKSHTILSVLAQFQGDFFQAKGVTVALCKLRPDSGNTFRWMEFVDATARSQCPFGKYVPQYDMANVGQELETAEATLQFPKGVAVEALMDDMELVLKTPPEVNDMMVRKGCMDLYHALEDCLVSSGMGDKAGWSEATMKHATEVLVPQLEAKGISVYLSAKREPGDNGGNQSFYWMEFVDRDLQPNYRAQRGMDMKAIPPGAMTKAEMANIAMSVATSAAVLACEVCLF